MRDDSECKKGILCDFLPQRKESDALIEVCSQCGKRVIYTITKEGWMDDKKYARDHKRDTLQPFGKNEKLFKKIYGTSPIESAIKFHKNKVSKEKSAELSKEAWEKRVWMRRSALKGLGKTEEEIIAPLRHKTKTWRPPQ